MQSDSVSSTSAGLDPRVVILFACLVFAGAAIGASAAAQSGQGAASTGGFDADAGSEYVPSATIQDENTTPVGASSDTDSTEVDPFVAPYGSIDSETDGEVVAEVSTPGSTIATGDVAVTPFPGDYIELDDGADLESVFTVQVFNDPPYQDPRSWNLTDDEVQLHYDTSTGTVYASFNTSTAYEDTATGDVSRTDGDVDDALSLGLESTITITANESHPAVDLTGPDEVTADVSIVSRSLSITAPSRRGIAVLEDTELHLETTVAPETEVDLVASSSNGTTIETYAFAVPESRTVTVTLDDIPPGTDIALEGTTLYDGSLADNAVFLPGFDTVDSIDAERLAGESIYCCRAVAVGPFEDGETVRVQNEDGSTVTELPVEEGAVTIQPTAFKQDRSYTLVPENGREYGPFEIRSGEISQFDVDKSMVGRGEQVNFTVETNRSPYTLALSDRRDGTPPRTIARAVEAAHFSSFLGAAYLDASDDERTVSVDTSVLPPGEYEFVGAAIDADAAASAELEVLGNDGRVTTSIAPAATVDPNDPPAAVRANLTHRQYVARGDVVAVDLPTELDDNATVDLRRPATGDTWSAAADGIVVHDDGNGTVITVDTSTVGSGETTPSIDPEYLYELVVGNSSTERTAWFRVEDWWISGIGPVSPPDIFNDADAPVSVRTNFAPGTTIEIAAWDSLRPAATENTTVRTDGISEAQFEEYDWSFRLIFATQLPEGHIADFSVRFRDDFDTGFDPREPSVVDTTDSHMAAGFPVEETVILWRVEEGDPVEPVSRLLVNKDGTVELHPGVLEPTETYVVVDRNGEASEPIEAYDSTRLGQYANDGGRIHTEGLRAAVDDWQAGDIGTGLLIEVLDAWQSGDPVV